MRMEVVGVQGLIIDILDVIAAFIKQVLPGKVPFRWVVAAGDVEKPLPETVVLGAAVGARGGALARRACGCTPVGLDRRLCEKRVRKVAFPIAINQAAFVTTFAANKGFDPTVGFGLLMSKLIAREGEDGERFIRIAGVELRHACVAHRSFASERRDVDDECNVPFVRAQRDILAININKISEIEEVNIGQSRGGQSSH